MQKLDFVPDHAGIKKVKIKKIVKLDKKEPVYNMEVENVHNFSINGGLIVHNCVDAIFYALNDHITNKARTMKISRDALNQMKNYRYR